MQVGSDHAVEVVPDSGHFVFLEQPQRFNAALLRTTASYLPKGLAARLIQQEEQDRLQKMQQLQQEAEQISDKQQTVHTAP